MAEYVDLGTIRAKHRQFRQALKELNRATVRLLSTVAIRALTATLHKRSPFGPVAFALNFIDHPYTYAVALGLRDKGEKGLHELGIRKSDYTDRTLKNLIDLTKDILV